MTGNNWKWWHFLIVGILISACGGFQLYSGKISKGLGSEALGIFCVVFGIFSRNSERKASDGKGDNEGDGAGQGGGG